MKCIKCNYTSFDYNQTCPKCGKDLSGETEKLHLPSYKPTPPYLLTSLTGETGGVGSPLDDEQSGVPSFLENQNEEMFMLNKNMIDSSEIHEENSRNDGDDELMVALDELSFEYEPALEEGSETPDPSQSDDLFMPEFSQEEITPSTDSVLFDKDLMEDAPPFAPMDETDELLISLDELSFEQEPVTPDDSPKKEHIEQNELSISELLDFDEENFQGQTGPVVGSNLADKPAFGDFEEESSEAFEITTHSTISDQSANVEDYIELDLSDIDQSKDRVEDSDIFMSFEEDVSEKALPEEDEISLIPNMLSPEETTAGSKDRKTKTESKKDYIELDILEMEVD